MKRFSNFVLSATLGCCAAAAQAGTPIKAADLPQITNGGTGFIGVTESAGMPRQPVDWRSGANGMKFTPLPAGEASTFVNGQPNVDPYAPGRGMDRMAKTGDRMRGDDARAMGSNRDAAAARAGFPANASPLWGTPD
jgi:hypothetical protein